MGANYLNIELATAVENAVIEVFKCTKGDINQFADTYHKKIVVHVLYDHFEVEWHSLGRFYQMTYLYVPTASEQIRTEALSNKLLNDKLQEVKYILNNLKKAM